MCRFEFEVKADDSDAPAKLEKLRQPFQEIEWCWGYIGYVNFFQYHIETDAEVTGTEGWNLWRDARNTDVILDEEKISRILRVALQKTQSVRPRSELSSVTSCTGCR